MKRFYLLLFWILLVGLIAKPCFSEEVKGFTFDGYTWELWDDSTKLGWVVGFYDALDQAVPEVKYWLLGLGITFPPIGIYQDVVWLFRKRLDELGVNLAERCDLSGITFRQIVDGLDKFYQDDRNKTVLTREAIWVVKLERKGAPQEFIDLEKRILRVPKGQKGNTGRWSLMQKSRLASKVWRKWQDQIPVTIHR